MVGCDWLQVINKAMSKTRPNVSVLQENNGYLLCPLASDHWYHVEILS